MEKFVKNDYSITLENTNFEKGSLKKISNIRPNRLFTAEKNLIIRNIGRINTEVFDAVIAEIIEILRK